MVASDRQQVLTTLGAEWPGIEGQYGLFFLGQFLAAIWWAGEGRQKLSPACRLRPALGSAASIRSHADSTFARNRLGAAGPRFISRCVIGVRPA
jgi:hypothetical protein